MMRALGSVKRLPLAPAVRRNWPSEAEAHRGDVAGDELHRVVDRHAGGDGASRAVDVEPDVALGVLALEVEELGTDLVGDVVVDVRAEHDDPALQQLDEDVVAGIEGLGHGLQATRAVTRDGARR
jgi:hypothetical protein